MARYYVVQVLPGGALFEYCTVHCRFQFYYDHVVNNVSSWSDSQSGLINNAGEVPTSLRYSPISACLKHVIAVGSNLLASAVLLAVTPNPLKSQLDRRVWEVRALKVAICSPKVYHPLPESQRLDELGNPRSIYPHAP